MNPMHQLTRRPVKAAFGALLLALAGVILALSGGQFWAAARTRAGGGDLYHRGGGHRWGRAGGGFRRIA